MSKAKPQPAGYSGTPLPQKLGIKPGANVVVLGAPKGFDATLGALPPGARVVTRAPKDAASVDVVLLFETSREKLRERFARATEGLKGEAGVWICWPKKAARVPTDITEDVLREDYLPTGYVDNKVCAVDATWSGLRFVLRKELRKR